MKKIIVLVALLFSVFKMYSQTNVKDVVYLKDGNKITGKILEIVPKKFVKIELEDSSIKEINLDEVRNIGKDESNVKDTRKSKYVMILDFAYSQGTGDIKSAGSKAKNEDEIYSASIIQSSLSKKLSSIGIGFGIDKFKEINQIPLFLDLRQQFFKSRLKAAIIFDVGYNIGIRKEEEAGLTYKDKGGFMVNPQIGLVYKLSKASSAYLSFGYKSLQQQIQIKNDDNEVLSSIIKTGGFITFRIGFAFG